ncbi:unnamed protein product [Peniophora sp. CBMAI 1063]|nr:unnamed protein product [Peniophora sp. CBMAI 1063]
MFSKVAIVALAAGAQVSFAVPLTQEQRSLKAVGTALVGGAASLITGEILNNKRSESGVMVDTQTGTIYADIPDTKDTRSLKAVGTAIAGGIASGVAGAAVKSVLDNRSLSAIENFFKNLKRDEGLQARSLSAIENFFSNLKREEPEARSLSAIENFFKNLKRDGDLDARSLSAIENFLSNLKRSETSGLLVDTETGTLYMDVPDAVESRSLKAIGTAVAGGIASGVAGAVVKDVLGNNKRSGLSGLMVDTETGTIYADIPDANEGRSLKAVGTAIAGGIASGVAGAVASDVLGRSEPSGLMVDTDTGIIYADVPDANEGRSLKAIGTAVAGGIASGVAGAVAKDVFGNNKRAVPSGLMVDTDTGVLYMDVPDANEGRSLKAVGTALAGAAASYVTGQILNNKRDSGLMVDTDTGVIYMDVPDANEDRSLSAIENFLSNLKRDENEARSLSAIENFFKNLKREEPEARSLSAIENFFKNLKRSDDLDARSLSAIENFLSNLKREEPQTRSLSAIENFFKNLKREEPEARTLSAIENFFSNLKREEHEARSLSAIENFFKNLKRSDLVESMAKRAIDDLE